MKDVSSGQSLLLRGAQVILEDEIVQADVCVADGQIAEIGTDLRGDRVVDAGGLFLAPALIDVHGDAFERQIMPRPKVMFDMETAILETDRQLAGNGIATAYHAVSFSWAPGLRSTGKSRALIEAIARLRPRLTVENRVQLRWEAFAFDAVEDILTLLQGPVVPSVAFNDHMSMSMLDPDVTLQDRAFEHSAAFRAGRLDDPRMPARFNKEAGLAGLAPEAFYDLACKVWERRPEVPARIAQVAEAARAVGAPMLSHDDTRIETRQFFRDLGSRVAEFPMTLEAAEAARAGGDRIIFGSPNATRGGSHIGSLGAADMVEAGLCDALASDYYYPAMLAAVARLDREKRASRSAIWSLVSKGPAQAMGLSDRGRIGLGQRADLVLVDWPDQGAPAVRATFVAGRIAYKGMPLVG